MYSLHERFIAAIFEDLDKSFKVFYHSSEGYKLYCQMDFDWTFNNTLTDVEIT